MMTPVVANLRRVFPRAQIHFATGQWSRPVIEDSRMIDRVLTLDGYGWRLGRRLARHRYDLIVVTDVGIGAIMTARVAGARLRVGFDVGGRGRWLTHWVPRSAEDDRHEGEVYLDLLRALGLEVTPAPPFMRVGEAEAAWAPEALAGYLREAGLEPERPLVAVFPGGGHNPGTHMPSKRWTVEGFGRVAAEVARRHGANVLLLGGPQDVEVVGEVISAAGRPVANAAGKTSLKETAALIGLCHLFIGNDCGPLHMAAALGVRTVSVFGPTPAAKLAPVGPGHRSVASPVSCSPCYRLVLNTFEECPGPECMRRISAEMVLEAVEAVWSEEPERTEVSEAAGI